MQLDYNSSLPLHIQLKDIIEKQVDKGELTGKIPSERQFMENYQVSRSTVREAIHLLVREGVLEKRHGTGTFVSLKSINEWLGDLISTSDTIKQMGMEPGAKLLTYDKVVPPLTVQEKTGFAEAYFIKRVRFADHIPFGVECHYFPVSIGEELIQYDLDDVSFYEFEENELGIRFAEANQTIGSGIISDEDANHLNIPSNSHVLIAERLIQNQEKQIVELEEAFYRSDLYQFTIHLSRKFG